MPNVWLNFIFPKTCISKFFVGNVFVMFVVYVYLYSYITRFLSFVWMSAAKAHTRHSDSSDWYQLIEKLTIGSFIVRTTVVTIPRVHFTNNDAKEKRKGKLKINISLWLHQWTFICMCMKSRKKKTPNTQINKRFRCIQYLFCCWLKWQFDCTKTLYSLHSHSNVPKRW